MKFRILIIFFLVFSCSPHLTKVNQNTPYSASGFALIYNIDDYNEKIIKGKMNNEIMQISSQNLKTGTLIKISNPKNKESIVLKNIKKIKYPEFYKVLITKPVAKKLNLNTDLPILEIMELKKNKSFIAEKAKIYNEEKIIPSKAPVASVQISNISKNKINNLNNQIDEIYIYIGNFYSTETAKFLKQRIIKEITDYDVTKLKIKKINDKETLVISGPYKSVNLLKNDYIKLKNFGFEEMDIYIND